MPHQVYAPGCALVLYKPHLAERVRAFLEIGFGEVPPHPTCCRHEPDLAPGTVVINTCAGCDRRFRELYEGISTVSLWEVLAESESFPFPDYGGATMTIHDACPTRTEERVHTAVRSLLSRMNIRVIEPVSTRTHSVCCGDSFFGQLPDEQVEALMKRRAESMPCDDVVVYCVSCVKAMRAGGKRPRYLVDLLFGEDTVPGVLDPNVWHAELDAFIEAH
jgi:Fe-S oxidoreductase